MNCKMNPVKGHPSVFINPPRLADFKQVLNKAGLQVYNSMYMNVTLLVLYMPIGFFPLWCAFNCPIINLLYIQAEFSGGVLVCNKCVAVRKVCFS